MKTKQQQQNPQTQETLPKAAAGGITLYTGFIYTPVSKPQPLEGQCLGHRDVYTKQSQFTF